MLLNIKVTRRLGVLLAGMVVSIPVLLYRLLLAVIASYLYSWRMVEARSAFFLAEDYDSVNSYTSVLIIELGADPRMDLPTLRRLVKEKLLIGPRYPELKSSVVHWMGYLFWKYDFNFGVERHVHDLKDLSISQPDWSNPNAVDELTKIILRDRPWRKDRPLWEMVLVQKDVDVTGSHECGSVLFLKYHHGLADGFAAFNVLGNLMDKVEFGEMVIPTKVQERHTVKDKLLEWMANAPGEIWQYYYAMEGASDRLHLTIDDASKEFRILSVIGDVQIVRAAKKKHCVDFNTTFVAGITAFYRRILEMNGKQPMQDTNLGITLLMPGHQGTLSNRVVLFNLVLPIGEPDPLKRLDRIYNQIKAKTCVPNILLLLTTWVGALPHSFVKLLRRRRLLIKSPFVASNLGGPSENCSLGETPVFGLRPVLNYVFDGPGFKIGLMTYKSQVRISATIKSDLLPPGTEDHLLNECFKEWEILRWERFADNIRMKLNQ